jgi:hypothetical protein
MADINLSPYTSQMEAIAQRRKMAELLSQQAMQPLEMPQVAGARVSPLAGLAKLLQAYTGRTMREEALAEQKALASQYQTDTSADFSSLLKALTPTAAVPEGPSSFTPNVSERDVVENPRMQMMPERDDTGRIIEAGQPSAGNFGVTPGTPAIPATRGRLTPEGFGGMKTDVGKQQYMAQLLAQIKPREPIKLGKDDVLLDPVSMKPIYQPEAKANFGSINPSQYTPESLALFTASGGKDFSLLRTPPPNLSFQNTGAGIQAFDPRLGTAVGTATPITVSPNTAAQLKQQRELSDRAFNGLSANQKAQLSNEAKRLNISAQQLYFDTGIQAGGGGVPNAPVTGAAPLVSGQPPNMPAPVATAPSALTPKAQQAMLLEEAQAKAKKERGMQGLGGVIDEARKIMTGTAVDQQGNPIRTPLPTQSLGGAAVDFVSGTFGGSPEGAAQADQLKVLGGALVMSMPRMEGPQSDRDVQVYREMAGQVGDNTLPIARRLKALDMVEALYRKYDRTSPTPPQIPDAPPPGAVRRVR